MKDGFIFHFENIEDIEDMSLEEQGLMFRAMIEFAQTGKEPEFEDRVMRAAWKPIRRRMSKDKERYDSICERNSKNIKSRWKNKDVCEDIPEDTNTCEDMPEDTTACEDTSEDTDTCGDVPEDTTVYENIPDDTSAIPKNTKNTNTDTETDTETDIERDRSARAREDITYNEIIGYLNQKTGAKFRADAKEARRCIRARWNEGYRLEDFKSVIDKKVKEWKGDAKMQIFLRPITLFSTKFESYLNQPRAKPKRNAFCNYEQRDDDLDEFEKQLDRQFAEQMKEGG